MHHMKPPELRTTKTGRAAKMVATAATCASPTPGPTQVTEEHDESGAGTVPQKTKG